MILNYRVERQYPFWHDGCYDGWLTNRHQRPKGKENLMVRVLTLTMVALFGLMAAIGCRAEAEIDTRNSGSIVAPQ